MITRSYKSKLKSVLRLYRDFRSAFEETGRPVSRDTESLYRKLHSPFSIAVISDRPGGSESFINACTGKEILPGDACTSAAIRILRGKSYSYEAETAGGRHLEGSGWKNVHEFLVQRVIVPGRYRYLPAACINDLLIKKQGAVTDGDIAKTEDALFRDSGSKESARLRFLVGQYIKRFRSQWENIVTEITFTVPLSEEFRGIAITDYPMIPAECNEWNTTRKPADDADAIIYVKPLDMKLPESECLNALPALPNRDNVFLVFTGRAALTDREFEDLRHKAIDTWSKAIPEDMIFFADCRAQRFIGSLEGCSAERIDCCLDELRGKGKNFKAAEGIWCSSSRNADLFLEKMEELAGFNEIHRAVGKFVRNARNRQLAEFLGRMIQDCDTFRKKAKQEAENLNWKLTADPEKLAFDILQKTIERNEAETVIKKGISGIENTYSGKWCSGGTILKKLQNDINIYINCLRQLICYNNIVVNKLGYIQFRMVSNNLIYNFDADLSVNDTDNINFEFLPSSPREARPEELPDFDQPHSSELRYTPDTGNLTPPQTNAVYFSDGKWEIYEPSPNHGYASLQLFYRYDGFRNIEKIKSLIDLLINYTDIRLKQYIEILEEHKDTLDKEINKLSKIQEDNMKISKDITYTQKITAIIRKIMYKLQELKDETSPSEGARQPCPDQIL